MASTCTWIPLLWDHTGDLMNICRTGARQFQSTWVENKNVGSLSHLSISFLPLASSQCIFSLFSKHVLGDETCVLYCHNVHLRFISISLLQFYTYQNLTSTMVYVSNSSIIINCITDYRLDSLYQNPILSWTRVPGVKKDNIGFGFWLDPVCL